MNFMDLLDPTTFVSVELQRKLLGPEGVEFAIATVALTFVLVPLLLRAGGAIMQKHGDAAAFTHMPFALFLIAIAGLMFVRESQFAIVAVVISGGFYALVCISVIDEIVRKGNKLV